MINICFKIIVLGAAIIVVLSLALMAFFVFDIIRMCIVDRRRK